MKHWTIRWRIIASFGVMLALIIIMTALQYNGLIAIETEATEVESLALSRLLRATAIRDAWADSLLVTQQFVFEPEEAVRRRLEGSLEHSRAALERAVSAVQVTVLTPEDREAVAAFKVAQSAYVRVQDELIVAAADPARRPQAVSMVGARLLPEYERGQAPITALVTQKERAAEAALAQVATDITSTVENAKMAALIDTAV